MQQANGLASVSDDDLVCDVCVVGSGPAGATVARELSGGRLRVVLLESGGPTRQPESDALNELENVGWPRVADQWLVRNRVVGGASHTWSGRCVPFDDIDFEYRPWVRDSGWPMPLASLTPYLDRAAAYLGMSVGTGFTGDAFWTLAGRKRPVPDFDPSKLVPHLWQFSRDRDNPRDYMRFGPRLDRDLGANVKLVAQATACDIALDDNGGAVRGVQAVGPGGERRRVSARAVVLCAGGIENPRLLLSANSRMAEGIGNQHGLVGRFLMDHLRGPTASFPPRSADTALKPFGHYRLRNGQVFAFGVRLSPARQRAEELLNCSAWLEGNITEDDPWIALKRCAKGDISRETTLAIAGNLGLLARGTRQYFVDRMGLPRKIDRLSLVCMSEQAPDRESRITLSRQRDSFGMPRARLDWRVHEQEARTIRRMTELVASEFARLGLTPPQPEPWVRSQGELPQNFVDVAHPTGTTRMGADPRRSVVDVDCQVHGVEGLYVAGSSVFPTSSHANPTQMIVALALRLSDTVRDRALTKPVRVLEAT